MHLFATTLGTSALALKELKIDLEASSGYYVRVIGRKSGLLSWFLSIVGIDTTTIFEVFQDHISFEEGSLSGRIKTTIPLASVSCSSSGYFKPIIYLVIGIPLLAVFGLGIIPIIYYFLRKSLLVSVTSHSGVVAAIAFKRSIIEGVKVNATQADEIIDIINQLVLKKQ